MVKKVTRNSYRKFYKKYYGIDFDSDFVVHHIDKNRNNNNVSNLILLPSHVHSKYHWFETWCDYYLKDSKHLFYSASVNPYLVGFISDKDFTQIMKELRFWHDVKMNIDSMLRSGIMSPKVISSIYQKEIDNYRY